MAYRRYYARRSYRGRYSRRRTYRRYRTTRYLGRSSVFKRRSELSGTDLSRQTFHLRAVLPTVIPANAESSTISLQQASNGSLTLQGMISVLQSLNEDDQWKLYSSLYDQFRVSGIRVTYEIVGVGDTTVNINNAAYTFASALDRNGVVLDDADSWTIS